MLHGGPRCSTQKSQVPSHGHAELFLPLLFPKCHCQRSFIFVGKKMASQCNRAWCAKYENCASRNLYPLSSALWARGALEGQGQGAGRERERECADDGHGHRLTHPTREYKLDNPYFTMGKEHSIYSKCCLLPIYMLGATGQQRGG